MATVDTVLLTDNDRHRKYTGVDKFHKAGYFGERVKASTGEDWSLSAYNPGGRCFDPLNMAVGADSHAINTAATFFQVAPKAKLYMLYATNGRFGTDYDSKFFNDSVEIIEKENITSMFVSLLATKHKGWHNDLGIWMDNHPYFKWFWAAGNESSKSYNPVMEVLQMFGVAAYTLMADGSVVPAYYTSLSPYVDFAAPSMIRTNTKATHPDDTCAPNAGTSFSTPWLCGMMALVDDFFIDKCGGPLTREAMEQFMRDNCKDMNDPGFDTKTGWGAVILPDPATIDIDKFWKIGRHNANPVTPVPDPIIEEVIKMLIDKYADRDKISAWAVEGVEWAVQNGIITGIGGNKLAPDQPLTREQMCVMLERFAKRLKENDLTYENI